MSEINQNSLDNCLSEIKYNIQKLPDIMQQLAMLQEHISSLSVNKALNQSINNIEFVYTQIYSKVTNFDSNQRDRGSIGKQHPVKITNQTISYNQVNILICNLEPEFCCPKLQLLERYPNFQTTILSDLFSLKETVSRSLPDVIIFDSKKNISNMPSLLAVLNGLRTFYDQSIIVLGRKFKSENAELLIKNGANVCLPKPYKVTSLAKIVKVLHENNLSKKIAPFMNSKILSN